MVTGTLEKLRTLYKTDQTARLMLDVFAGYQRNRRTIKVDNLLWKLRQQSADVSRAEVVKVFKELEDSGFGKYMPGRWEHPSRFEWNANLIEVGKAASGDEDVIEPLEAAALGDSSDEPDMVEHLFRLRPDLQVLLELPENLTRNEAARLAEFVKSLPFE